MRVHALMVSRRDQRQAQESFYGQTWKNARLWSYRPRPGESLGEARESLLQGVGMDDAFCQWDDDDWRDPRYLEVLAEVMEADDSDIAALLSETLECRCGQRVVSVQRRGKRGLWEHSALVRREFQHGRARYSPVSLGEDTDFMRQLIEAGAKVSLVDAPELYVYRFHGGNVTSAKHWDRLFIGAGSTHRPSECVPVPKPGAA